MDSSSIGSQDEPFRAASCDRPMSMKVRPSAHIRSRQRPGNGTSSQYIHTGALSTGNGTDITSLGTAATTHIVEPDTGNRKSVFYYYNNMIILHVRKTVSFPKRQYV